MRHCYAGAYWIRARKEGGVFIDRLRSSTPVKGEFNDGDIEPQREEEAGKEREGVDPLVTHRPTVNSDNGLSFVEPVTVFP